jgi:hypothetical protein
MHNRKAGRTTSSNTLNDQAEANQANAVATAAATDATISLVVV